MEKEIKLKEILDNLEELGTIELYVLMQQCLLEINKREGKS